MQDVHALRRAFAELTPYGALLEVAMLVASLAIAYALVWLARGARRGEARSIWFGARLYDGVLFPLAALLAGVILRWALKEVLPVGLLRLAVPILTALVVIRLSVQVLGTAFPHSGGEDVVEAEVLAVESAPDQAPTEGGWWAG